jgi:hypothetical protein
VRREKQLKQLAKHKQYLEQFNEEDKLIVVGFLIRVGTLTMMIVFGALYCADNIYYSLRRTLLLPISAEIRYRQQTLYIAPGVQVLLSGLVLIVLIGCLLACQHMISKDSRLLAERDRQKLINKLQRQITELTPTA